MMNFPYKQAKQNINSTNLLFTKLKLREKVCKVQHLLCSGRCPHVEYSSKLWSWHIEYLVAQLAIINYEL